MADFVKIPDRRLYEASNTPRVKAVVGGRSQDYFAPSANFSFKYEASIEKSWFNICDDIEQLRTHELTEIHEGNRLELRNSQLASTFELGDTSLKFERVFYTKDFEAPRYTIKHSPDLSFHYQGELSSEDIADGAVRPDNVVGSFAVLSEFRNKVMNVSGELVANYGTGKVGHVYAPYWTDAEARVYKGTQILIGNTLHYPKPPQEWIDSAVLPIKLDPDLGYGPPNDIGGTSLPITPGQGLWSLYVGEMSEDGTLDSVSFYDADSSSGDDYYVGCYEGASEAPTNLVWNSTVQEDSGLGWQTVDAGDESLTDVTDYQVAIQAVASGDITLRYDTVTGYSSSRLSGNTPGNFPDPYGTPTDTQSSRRYSAYLTYTASGGAIVVDAGSVSLTGSDLIVNDVHTVELDSATIGLSGEGVLVKKVLKILSDAINVAGSDLTVITANAIQIGNAIIASVGSAFIRNKFIRIDAGYLTVRGRRITVTIGGEPVVGTVVTLEIGGTRIFKMSKKSISLG